MESANVQQKYQEIEYTETHPELKQSETMDLSQDPQTTERTTPKSSKENEKGYEQAAGEDGDTERRHFSSLPGSS